MSDKATELEKLRAQVAQCERLLEAWRDRSLTPALNASGVLTNLGRHWELARCIEGLREALEGSEDDG